MFCYRATLAVTGGGAQNNQDHGNEHSGDELKLESIWIKHGQMHLLYFRDLRKCMYLGAY